MRSRSRSGAVRGVAVFVLAGCAGMHAKPVARWSPAACEYEYAHEHGEHWNVLLLDSPSPGLCRFQCRTHDVERGDGPTMLRARLEPWCREMLPDDGRPLTGRFTKSEEGDRIYELVAEYDIVEDIPEPEPEPEAEATGLCEVFSGHRHNPDWLWFTQTVSPDERLFVCGIGEVAQGESEASARARIEPYCREMIAKALGGARECYGTRFLLAPSEVRLEGEFVDDEDGGRDYLLRGRVATD